MPETPRRRVLASLLASALALVALVALVAPQNDVSDEFAGIERERDIPLPAALAELA